MRKSLSYYILIDALVGTAGAVAIGEGVMVLN